MIKNERRSTCPGKKKFWVKLFSIIICFVAIQLTTLNVHAKYVSKFLGDFEDSDGVPVFYSEARDINDKGQIVGNIQLEDVPELTGKKISYYFLWENGERKDLGMVFPLAINNRSQVLGIYDTEEGESHLVLWENNEITDLGIQYGNYLNISAFNNKGQIVGSFQTEDGGKHGFLWENGKMIDLGTLGGKNSWAEDINDSGQIVGTSQTEKKGQDRAFLWENGEMKNLGTTGTLGYDSYAKAINEKGQIVGEYTDIIPESLDGMEGRYVFIYENGSMEKLMHIWRTDGEDRPGVQVVDINDNGQVLVNLYGYNAGYSAVWDIEKEKWIGTAQIANAINNKGDVVGRYPTSKAPPEAYLFEYIEDVIIPEISLDKSSYIKGDKLELKLALSQIERGDMTNSVNFEIEYDSDVFELMTGNVNKDIINGYIPFNFKTSTSSGLKRKIVVSYMDMSEDVKLQDKEDVLKIKFKVKKNAKEGEYKFTLLPVNLLDSSSCVYNVNGGKPATATAKIVEDAFVEGYVSIYLGDTDTELNELIDGSLNQEAINKTFENLKFYLKDSENNINLELIGSSAFIPDKDGNLASVDSNGRVTGKFLIRTKDVSSTIIEISGSGYLEKAEDVKLCIGDVCSVGSSNLPIILYPGDVGQIQNLKLELIPDGLITNTDFSAWLKIYNDNLEGNADDMKVMCADFTKDGVIDNVDFSLWMDSYTKQFTHTSN